jgi:hypothetical protein
MSKIQLNNVIGIDRLARGIFANRDHEVVLPLSRCCRDKGSDRGGEGRAGGKALILPLR